MFGFWYEFKSGCLSLFFSVQQKAFLRSLSVAKELSPSFCYSMLNCELAGDGSFSPSTRKVCVAEAIPHRVVSLFFVVVEVSSEVCFPIAAENMQDPKASRWLDSEESLGSVCICRGRASVVHVFHDLF